MKTLPVIGLFANLFAVTVLLAQSPPEMPAPQKEHEWLKQFVGEWESVEATILPDQPGMK